MSIEKSRAKVISEIEGTPGGVTYIVKLPKLKEKKSLCFRPLKQEPHKRCTHEAGYRTDHLGTGACRFHGGNTGLNPRITNGMQAKVTRSRLQDKIDAYLGKDRSQLLDLSYHLAATRVIFDEFIDDFPEPGGDEETEEAYSVAFYRFNIMISTLGNLVDKITRIEARSTLTAAQILYIRATMVDLIMKYIVDPDDRDRFLREMANRMGGDMDLEMLPSEISKPTL